MRYKTLNIEAMNDRVARPKHEDERTALLDIIEVAEDCEQRGCDLVEALEWNRARRVQMIENKEGYVETPGICRAVIAEIDHILPSLREERASFPSNLTFKPYRERQ